MSLLHPVELILPEHIKQSLLSKGMRIPSKDIRKKIAEQNLIIARHKYEDSYFLVNPMDMLEKIESDSNYEFYNYHDIARQIKPQFLKTATSIEKEEKLIEFNGAALYKLAASTISNKINVDSRYGLRDILKNPFNTWNMTAQIGFPVIYNIAVGIFRAIVTINAFTKEHKRPPTEVERQVIYRDCAAYSARGIIGAGFAELGFFIGQCVITVCSLSPMSAWISATFAICCGLLRGIYGVVNKIMDEKNQYGEIKCSYEQLRNIFLNGFSTTALSVVIGANINFLSLFSSVVMVPIAEITGSFLAVASNYLTRDIVNRLIPTTAKKEEKTSSDKHNFFAEGIELQPVKMTRNPDLPANSPRTKPIEKKRQ